MSKPATKASWLGVVCLTVALPLAGQTCGDWSSANPRPQGNRLSGVTWSNGQFVTVGGGVRS